MAEIETDYTAGPATVLVAVDGKGHSDRAFTCK